MQILQDAGRIALAKSLAAMAVHVAWGRGDGVWAAPPATPSDSTALLDEICRREVVDIGYVMPATVTDYDVEMPEQVYYKRSTEPTPYLLLTTTFGFEDAQGETVRECAVFFGTVPVAGIPAGQRLLAPGDVAALGDMYSLEYRAPALRSGTTKTTEEIVLPL